MKRFLVLSVSLFFMLNVIAANGFCETKAWSKDVYLEFLDLTLQVKKNRGNISYELAAYETIANTATTMEQHRMNVENGLLDTLNAEVKSYQAYKDSLNLVQGKMAKARIAALKGWYELCIANRLGGFSSNYQEVSRQKRSALGIYRISQEMFEQQDKQEVQKFFENVQLGLYN